MTLSVRGVGLIVVPNSAGIACSSSLGNKVKHKITISKNGEYKKNKKDQKSIKDFDKFYTKSLKDSLIDRNECESLWNNFKSYFDEKKHDRSFYK